MYYFPLHHVSDIVIFYLNMFRSIMKHCVLKEIYTKLWLSSWNPSHDQENMSEVYEAALLHTLNDTYYAYVVFKATKLCFLLHQETMADPKVEQQPDVLFQSTTLPSQSASTYPCKLKSTLEAYLRPYPLVLCRYLNTCFIDIQ